MNKEKITSKLKNELIIFLSPDFTKGIGLEKYIPNYAIICGHKSDGIALARKNKINIFCLGEIQSENLHNSGKILESKETIKFIKNLSKKLNINIISFKASSKINFICEKQGWKVLNLHYKTTNKLENKNNFTKYLEQIDIPKLPTITTKLKDISFKKITEKFNIDIDSKIVIQFAKGFAGNSTYFLKKDGFLKLKQENIENKVKITPFISGKTLTLNGCIYNNKILLSCPFLQKTGIPEFSQFEGGSCGVDFDAQNLQNLCKKTLKSAKKIIKTLKLKGLNGFFGLDFITDDKNSYPVEINPRLTASIHPFTSQQIHSKQIPFIILHILEFLNIKINIDPCDYLTQFKGETTIYRNISKAPYTVSQAQKVCHYSFLELLENKQLTSIFIPLANGSIISEGEKWAEKWEL